MLKVLIYRMPKSNSGGHHDWLSRDYADLDCQAMGCIFNHNMKCIIPSRCKIGTGGMCEGFLSKETPKKPDGD